MDAYWESPIVASFIKKVTRKNFNADLASRISWLKRKNEHHGVEIKSVQNRKKQNKKCPQDPTIPTFSSSPTIILSSTAMTTPSLASSFHVRIRVGVRILYRRLVIIYVMLSSLLWFVLKTRGSYTGLRRSLRPILAGVMFLGCIEL
jgi:hypothetical protein